MIRIIVFLFSLFFIPHVLAYGEYEVAQSMAQSKEEAEQKYNQAQEDLKKLNELTIECSKGSEQKCLELDNFKSYGKIKADPSFVDKFTSTFTKEINKWIAPIEKAAKYLLFTFAIIGLVLLFIPLILKGAELGEILKELVIFVLVISIWFAFIINAKDWTNAIIDSFSQLAVKANASSADATPVGVITQGFIVAGKTIAGSYNPITLLGQLICALILIVIYAKIAFYVLKVILETMIISYAGIILLGFGGLSFTSDYAKRYFTYVLSCGIKLFITLLIVGFGTNFIAGYVNSFDMSELGNCLGMICIVLMLMFIAEQIPDMAQSMVTGASLGGGNMNIGGTLATMAAAATAFTAACYAGAAAFKAAGAANAAGGGGAATGGLSGGDLANALSKGGGSGVAGGGGSGGSSSLPNGGKSGAQLVKEGKVQSPNKNTGNTATGTESGKPQQSRTGAALKAVAKSVGEGILNKAAGSRGSTAANITRAALNHAAQSQQSTESPRKPIASPYAKSTGNNSSGTSKMPNKGNNDTGENQ